MLAYSQRRCSATLEVFDCVPDGVVLAVVLLSYKHQSTPSQLFHQASPEEKLLKSDRIINATIVIAGPNRALQVFPCSMYAGDI